MMDWELALDHLDFVEEEYERHGAAGREGVRIIRELWKRYEEGERTVGLYNDMMEVQ